MKDGDGLFTGQCSFIPDREEEALNRNKGDKPKAFCVDASSRHQEISNLFKLGRSSKLVGM
jgi:hypothetical protein